MGDSDEDSDHHRSRDKFRRERSDFENRHRSGDKREPFDDRMGGGGMYNRNPRFDRRGPADYRSFGGRDRGPSDIPNKRPRRDFGDDHRPSYRSRENRSNADDLSNYRPPLMPFKRFLDPLDDLITDEEAMAKYKDYKDSFNKRYIEEFFEAHKLEEW